MSILQLENVMKAYGKNVAVNNVSFEVPKGSIFGLLGPNGAGKTSLIRIITTITRADTGRVYLDGEPLNNRHPEQIGYMPEERGLYRQMRVGEHLLYLARLKGMSKSQARDAIHYWFDKFNIKDWYEKKVEELSKGMQQKIQFIATVMHDPKLLILDEPFSGLDPINTNLIKDEIHELHEKGASIIFSTHRMEQVEEVCEYIVLINKGENVLEGRVTEVKDRFKRNRFEVVFRGDLPAAFDSQFQVVEKKNNSVIVQLGSEGEETRLLRFLLQHDIYIRSFNEILPSLNEIFIRQVGEDEGRRLLMGEE